MLPLLLFAIVVNTIAEKTRWGVVNKLLYADDLVFMSETTEDLQWQLYKNKEGYCYAILCAPDVENCLKECRFNREVVQ